MSPLLHTGIVFNTYEPKTNNCGERRSEESVADMAREVYEAVKIQSLFSLLCLCCTGV